MQVNEFGERNNSSISSSVIQRSLVPYGLNVVLSVASVPVKELGVTSDREEDPTVFTELTAEILGIPKESFLDETQYQKLKTSLRKGDFWDNIYRNFPRPPYYYDHYRYFGDLLAQSSNDQQKPETDFAIDALSLMADPIPQSPMLLLLPESRLFSRGNYDLDYLEITPEALQIGLACIFSGANPDARVARFRTDVQNYHIPTGQSPSTQSDSLLKLIETSKKMCLAPLAAGGTVGITQLTQGALVHALLCTGTGAAMTLVLIGTIAVADLLVRYLMQKRPHREISSSGG